MKITAVETVRTSWYPRPVWVRLHTDDGLIGLGETTGHAAAVEAQIHEELADYLIGADPRDVAGHHDALKRRARIWRTLSIDTQAVSAVDIALWDLAGQAVGQPIHRVLGGALRDRIPVYNTCASAAYATRPGNSAGNLSHPAATGGATLSLSKGGTGGGGSGAGTVGTPDDLQWFLTDAGELAKSLLAEGITAMKIWPFDQFAPASNGQFISLPDIEKGLEPFRKIRDAVGDRMEIAAELHGMWNLPSAIRIARALEPFNVMWIEDPVNAAYTDGLAQVADAVSAPVAASESLATREAYREVLDRGRIGVCMLDVTWVGGLTEALAVVAMAQSAKVPLTPHDCTGPVNLMAGLHLSIHAPGASIQETVRSFNREVYPKVVDRLPRIEGGFAYAPTEPGLGMGLREEFLKDPRTTVRRTER